MEYRSGISFKMCGKTKSEPEKADRKKNEERRSEERQTRKREEGQGVASCSVFGMRRRSEEGKESRPARERDEGGAVSSSRFVFALRVLVSRFWTNGSPRATSKTRAATDGPWV